MKYPAYNKYKDSGVAWLGGIPEDWDYVSLKWISKIYAGGTPDKTKFEYWDDGTIPWLNSGEVNQFTIYEPSTYITEEGYKNSSTKYLEIDSLVMALAGQGKTKGMIAQTKIRATCNQSMAAIEVLKHKPRFILWWLNSQYENIRNLAGGDARDGLNLEMVGSIICPIPSSNEQQAIAEFLDKKTVEIDGLIAKQEELLKRLAEKRTALITHAVTKGLNPKAPMKESGVDWLGQIPAHWGVKQLKHCLTIQNGRDYKEVEADVGYPVIGSGGQFTFASEKLFEGEAILLGRKGTIDKPLYINGPFWTVDTMYYAVPSKYCSAKFLYYCALKIPFSLYSTDTALPSMTRTAYGNHPIAIPELKEQNEIVRYLDDINIEIDDMVKNVSILIDRLKEYRSSLISNAVTGKIRVI